jgi:quercetin dioxygenase-like cupin family protein
MVVQPGGGEVIGDSPDRRVEILSEHDALHVTLSRFGPGREGADLHVHRRHTDVFYVIEGELTIRLGVEDEQIVAPTGTVARVPPMVVHGFRNASDADVRYLNLHVPGAGFADYMRGLRDGRKVPFDQEPPPDQGVRPASDAVIGPPPVEEPVAIAELRGALDGPEVDDALLAFYVLEGDLTVIVDGREHRAPAGAWAEVPPGAAHSVAGNGRYVRVAAPGV